MTADSISEIAARIEELAAKIAAVPGCTEAAAVEDLERIITKMDLHPDFLAAEPSAARAYHQLIETVARFHQRPN